MNGRSGLAGMVGAWMLLPLLASAALAVAGYLPTRSRAGARGPEAMLIALSVVTGVAYATMIPAVQRMNRAPDAQGRFKAAMRAGVERFMLTVAIAAAVAWRGDVLARVFLVWVAVGYIVMVAVETLILIRFSQRPEKRS